MLLDATARYGADVGLRGVMAGANGAGGGGAGGLGGGLGSGGGGMQVSAVLAPPG